MHIDPTTLFLVWFGGGFVIFLVWAALVGEAVMGERPDAVRSGIAILALVGIVHPAAAVGAVDLVRLGRSLATAPVDESTAPSNAESRPERADALALPLWAVATVYGCAVVSVAVTVGALVEAGGFP